MDWKKHWGLTQDPFAANSGGYVALPGHEEAVARLVHTIEAGHRLAVLTGPEGSGKTRVLRRTLAEVRNPCRRLALVSQPLDEIHLYSRLAEALGSRGLHAANRAAAWMALERQIRTCALQGFHVVLAIDESQALLDGASADGMRRLAQIGKTTGGRVIVLLILGEEERGAITPGDPWMLNIRLARLTCSEAETYLTGKLSAMGCHDSIFSQRAVSRLHSCSGGTPSGLDRLASLCLIAGAYRGLEAVSSELVEGVLGEFHPPARALV